MLSLEYVKSLVTQFKANEDGNIAMMMGVGVLVLVASVGLAIDTLGARNAQQELQSHLDVISMAIVTSGIVDAAEQQTFAQELLEANDYNIDPANLTIQITPAGEVSVTGRTEYELAFGGIFNKSKLDVSAHSSAIAGGTSVTDPVDVVLVLDTTGSMAGTKMTALQSSANLLIDTLDGGGSQVQMGVVPFAAYVNVGLNNRNEFWLDLQPEVVTKQEHQQILVTPGYCAGNPNATLTRYRDGVAETYTGCDNYVDDVYMDGPLITVTEQEPWHGCVLSRSRGGSGTSTLHLNDEEWAHEPVSTLNRGDWMCGLSPLLPLTNQLADARASINGLAADGDTYMPGGIAWGWRVLTPNAPFTGGRANTKQVMVIMTDGANSMYKGFGRTHPRIDFGGPNETADVDRVTDHTETLCQNVKNDNIEVFTIAFEVTDAATRNMLSGCADSTANYFDARNAQELEDAFEEIGNSIASGTGEARLTR